MSSSSAMIGSSGRVARSRTSIAIRRLPNGGAGRDGRRGLGLPEPSAGAVATELVAYLVRRAAHEDARSAYYPQNHVCTLRRSTPKYKPNGQEFPRPAGSTIGRDVDIPPGAYRGAHPRAYPALYPGPSCPPAYESCIG